MGGMPTHFELSDSVYLDEADSATKTHLERVRAFVANEQWDEAVETLRQVMENHGEKVVATPLQPYMRDYLCGRSRTTHTVCRWSATSCGITSISATIASCNWPVCPPPAWLCTVTGSIRRPKSSSTKRSPTRCRSTGGSGGSVLRQQLGRQRLLPAGRIGPERATTGWPAKVGSGSCPPTIGSGRRPAAAICFPPGSAILIPTFRRPTCWPG